MIEYGDDGPAKIQCFNISALNLVKFEKTDLKLTVNAIIDIFGTLVFRLW